MSLINFKQIKSKIIHIAIFASGSGTNTNVILDYFKNSSNIRVDLIVCNKETAGVVEIAKKNNIPFLIITKDLLNNSDYLLNQLASIDFIVLAGFLLKIPAFLVKKYPNKIINIHPALLPKFGGKGMYGHFVHEAVIANKETKSGITIHYVTEEYDEGNIIFQKEIMLEKNETALTLEKKIHQLEHEFFPSIIKNTIELL